MIPTTASVADLAQRWKAGDRAAGSELVRAHDSWIVYHAKRFSFASEDVLDVAQEMRLAFLGAATRVDPQAGDASTIRFLRTAMRRHIMTLRRDRKSPTELTEAEDWPANESTDVVGLIEAKRLLRDSRLTPLESHAVSTKCFLGMTDAEAAIDSGASPSGVRLAFNAAMARMMSLAGADVTKVAPETVRTTKETGQRILDMLARDGSLTGAEIVERLGVKRNVFWRSVTRLRKAGLVVSIGGNRTTVYALAKRKEAA